MMVDRLFTLIDPIIENNECKNLFLLLLSSEAILSVYCNMLMSAVAEQHTTGDTVPIFSNLRCENPEAILNL